MTQERIVNFISGHLDLTEMEFNQNYRVREAHALGAYRIDNALKNNQGFVVGDARGTDTLAQQYLLGKTDAVVVYHMFESPRNNAGFPTRGGFQSDAERDKKMTQDSHQDIAWVRPGREKSGTQKNLDRRGKFKS